jgi:hypothetical protein
MNGLALALALAGCDSKPSDLREWSAGDHFHEAKPSPQAQATQSTGEARNTMPGLDDVAVATWSRKCMSCHGQVGRGDTPQGQALKARDLSDPEWHKTVTDDQLFASIKNGRGLMPPSQLPDSTITSLVKLVRLLSRDSELWKQQREAQAAQGQATEGDVQPASASEPAPRGGSSAKGGASNTASEASPHRGGSSGKAPVSPSSAGGNAGKSKP